MARNRSSASYSPREKAMVDRVVDQRALGDGDGALDP